MLAWVVATAYAANDAASVGSGVLTLWILGAVFGLLLLAVNVIVLGLSARFSGLESATAKALKDLKDDTLAALARLQADLKEGSQRFRAVDTALANHQGRLAVVERTCELQHGPLMRRVSDPPDFDGRDERCHGGVRKP